MSKHFLMEKCQSSILIFSEVKGSNLKIESLIPTIIFKTKDQFTCPKYIANFFRTSEASLGIGPYTEFRVISDLNVDC